MEDRCVACGAIIPEGRQVCKECEIRHGVIEENQEDQGSFGKNRGMGNEDWIDRRGRT